MLIFASGSPTRAALLTAAGLTFETEKPRLDEEGLAASLLAEGCGPRDLADALAEAKAARVAARRPGDLVLGSDQVLSLDGRVLLALAGPEEARERLRLLAGRTHHLHSAAVLFEAGVPVWRHVNEARLTMGSRSEAWLDGYLARNWPRLGDSPGAYRIEEEGVRLFERVEGDHWTVLGLPLLPLLSFLAGRGSIPA